MPTLYQPQYKLTINNFDVTNSVLPFLLSIELEDFFDTNLTVSKLDLIFHARYRRSINWQYKDQLKLELWWLPYPVFKLISAVFYVDTIEDIKSEGGLQTFRVSAMEADPTLGFDYGVKQIVLTNKTTKQAVLDFKNAFGLTLSENMTSNVYIGTVDNATGTPTPDLNTVKQSFDSYADMLRYICQTFGYLGNLSGKNLQLYKIESTFSDSSRFFVWSMGENISFNSKQSFNNLKKTYKATYVNRGGSSPVLATVTLNPAMSAQLNNKVQNVEINNAYYNLESGSERLYGEMYNAFLTSFEIELTCSALPEFKAGNMFLLDSSYGFHEGYYRCTSVRHRVDGSGWIATVKGFPIDELYLTSAVYNVGYVGRTTIPASTINVSQTIRGTTTITGTQLDNYAKTYNPNYTSNIGATFVSEGNKTANSIRADIAFCLALLVTNNFTKTELINKRNPGDLTDNSGFNVATFPDWLTGTRATIQHMYAFAVTTGTPADPIVDPRYSFVSRGSATTIDTLSTNWNSSLDFSTRLKEKLKQLHMFLNPNATVNIQ